MEPTIALYMSAPCLARSIRPRNDVDVPAHQFLLYVTKWLTTFILFNKLIATRANNSKLLLLHS
jgi:hypothetical protein